LKERGKNIVREAPPLFNSPLALNPSQGEREEALEWGEAILTYPLSLLYNMGKPEGASSHFGNHHSSFP